MPLCQNLCPLEMTFKCPRCGLALLKPGRWFQVASKYRCEGCQSEIRITYPDKIALFQKYAASQREGPSPPKHSSVLTKSFSN